MKPSRSLGVGASPARNVSSKSLERRLEAGRCCSLGKTNVSTTAAATASHNQG